jgi:membrane protease YdiL (CAAX protease family)
MEIINMSEKRSTEAVNDNSTINNRDKMRWGLTFALGMLVLFWRIVLPSNVEITTGIVILVAALDSILTGALISINRKELKEIFAKKNSKGKLGKNILWCVLFYMGANIFTVVTRLVYSAVTGIEVIAVAPAAWVADEFQLIFPLGIFISTVIAAPVWEEIAFRMAGKGLLKNPVLFVLASSLPFAFIHTVNFSIIDNSMYYIMGISFCLMYLKTKDLKLVMIVHAVINLIGFVAFYLNV